jgi:hypothetical protein
VTQNDTDEQREGATKTRPYPRPPQLGWYPEDREWLAQQKSEASHHNQPISAVQPTSEAQHPHIEQLSSDETVIGLHPMTPISSHPTLRLTSRSGARNQSVDITGDTVLGRKPLQQHFPGMTVCALVDPSRTMSREHALIRFDGRGRAWIEDLGSLNGTSLLSGQNETPVEKGKPVLLTPGVSLRLGDEFYQVSAVEPQQQ